jgi:hypothetical protein
VVKGDIVELDVSTPSRPNDVCLLDFDDLDKVLEKRDVFGNRMRWMSHNSCEQGHDRWGVYVTASNRKTRIHRIILNVNDPLLIVDHINGNTLDNRKLNLRIISRSENNKNVRMRITNTSGATGVEYNKELNNYKARITLHVKTFHLGTFNTLAEARAAYEGAKKTLGFSERHGRYVNP